MKPTNPDEKIGIAKIYEILKKDFLFLVTYPPTLCCGGQALLQGGQSVNKSSGGL